MNISISDFTTRKTQTKLEQTEGAQNCTRQESSFHSSRSARPSLYLLPLGTEAAASLQPCALNARIRQPEFRVSNPGRRPQFRDRWH